MDRVSRPIRVGHIAGEPTASRVPQLDLEVHLAVVALRLDLHIVGEIEAAFGLDDVLEHREHVAVLAVQLEFDLRLVPFEFVAAHRTLRGSRLRGARVRRASP